MSTPSQFIVYSSSDPNGPGYITGTTGSLLTILDACLVNGYTGHPAAGWSTGSLTRTGSLAAYIQPSGSKMTLFVNDMAPNVAAGATEAWTVGYETLTSLTSSNTLLISGSVGAGSGIFPTTVQIPVTAGPPPITVAGHLTCRKSTSASTVPRFWIMFADAYTMYFFVQSGDAASTTNLSATSYYTLMFGDIYSLRGPSDIWRCIIIGRNGENVSGFANGAAISGWYDNWDSIPAGIGSSLATSISAASSNAMLATSGHYIARNAYGGGSSIQVSKFNDISKTAGATTLYSAPNPTYAAWPIGGNIQSPNAIDNSYYMSPIWIGEPSAYSIRGRMRGMYQVCHPIASFYDGQIFGGSGDYAGKTFQIVKGGLSNGFVAIEISATVETN